MGYSAGSSLNKAGSSNATTASINGSVTVIPAGANLNGIIIRMAILAGSATGNGSIGVGPTNAALLYVPAVAGAQDRLQAPILIPAGWAVTLFGSAAAGCTSYIAYDIL